MASLSARRSSHCDGSDDADGDASMSVSVTGVDITSAADESDEAEWNGDTEESDESVESADDDDGSGDDSTADMEVSADDDDNAAADDDDDFERSSRRRSRLSARRSREATAGATGIAQFFSRGSGDASDDAAPSPPVRTRGKSSSKRKQRSERTERTERLHNRRRKIADVRGDDDLDASTRKARQAELERATHTIDFEQLLDVDGTGAGAIDMANDAATVEPLVCLNVLADGSVPSGAAGSEHAPVFVHASVSPKLKKHQIVGARFLWSHIAVEPHGFGCVLADFMGLGKTLQVLTVVQAFLALRHVSRDGVDVPRHRHVLILAPTICVRNWEAEVVKWFGKKEARRLGLTTLESAREKKMTDRVHVVKAWHRRGGLLIMGYELYRLLVLQSSGDEKIAVGNQKHAKAIVEVYKCLANPGPDLIVLDEGHRVRDHKSKLVKALSHVKTARRIILTGYPLQNHLEEYWTMVNFARPDFLGTLEEFKNRFVDPIKNGQCIDSSEADLRLARQRAYVLTRELKPLVLRRDQQYLFQQLPPKKEWVLICKLTDPQARLYRAFLESGVPHRGGSSGPADLLESGAISGKIDVLGGYHISMAIANHPDVLCESFHALEHELRVNPSKFASGKHRFQLHGEDLDGDVGALFDVPVPARVIARSTVAGGTATDDSDVDGLLDALSTAPSTSTSNPKPKASTGPTHRLKFAEAFVRSYEASQPEASGKMLILLALLAECRAVDDRVIVFSQSIPTLNTIEKLIAQANSRTRRHAERLSHLRIDGSTPQHERFRMIGQFNDTDEDVDVILISTKAGGEGINLCAGNRIVIFDVCWNPCNDAQSMCRSYRFGQTKPVFVYRFVTAGTMEKRVYDLQIRKEGVAKRIVDERTTERRFKSADLAKYFSLDDLEQSLRRPQRRCGGDGGAAPTPADSDGLDGVGGSMPEDGVSMAAAPDMGSDTVLQRVLAKFQDLGLSADSASAPPEPSTETETDSASPVVTGTSGCIVDWFEQETMFEEDLDQQCSPTEAAEIMESHLYNKSLRRLRAAGSHLISRDGLLYATCGYCRVNNEVYPERTTGVPVPKNLECSYCRRSVATAGAAPAPVVPQLPPGVRGVFPGMTPYAAAPGVAGARGGFAPLVVPAVDLGNRGITPAPSSGDTRALPPHLAAIYRQQQQNRERLGIAPAHQTEWERQVDIQTAQREREQMFAEQRRRERQTYELRDRCLLVLRRGMAGCQALKRAAEECGAKIAIEVNAQTTDIVSAMSESETLQFLKRTKLPKDVELRDDAWLRNEIAKAKGLAPTGSAVAVGQHQASSAVPSDASASGAGAAEAAAVVMREPTRTHASVQQIADASTDMIELLDSDNEGDAVAPLPPLAVRAIAARAPSGAAGASQAAAAQTIGNDNSNDDDDDVIEIF